jgi:ornithine carbamoyltransferase
LIPVDWRVRNNPASATEAGFSVFKGNKMKNLVTLFDLTPQDVREIFDLTASLKGELKQGVRKPRLAGQILTQVFEKPSLRTRVSFEAAMMQLGGNSIFLLGKDAGFDGRETTADIARVIGSYSDAIVLRTFAQSLIEEFAAHAGCCVINGLSDDSHPCQALTDLFTMEEVFGSLAGRRLAYVGDGNNVARSLALACAMLDVEFSIGTPPDYQLSDEFIRQVTAAYPNASLAQHTDPVAAVDQADIVYTDVWASMGQESEKDQRSRVFAPYQVNADLMRAAAAGARFMHCLPARRGLEVTDEVVDGPQSVVFPQAENRMHLSKGLLCWMLES